jgi:hypothetical protein
MLMDVLPIGKMDQLSDPVGCLHNNCVSEDKGICVIDVIPDRNDIPARF